MKRSILLLSLLIVFSVPGWAAQRYEAKGLILKVDKPKKTLIVSCEEIPGFMEAMAMPFQVRDSKELDGLAADTMIQFTGCRRIYVVHRIHPYSSL
jgi:Cu/Ag efflux protein CusF